MEAGNNTIVSAVDSCNDDDSETDFSSVASLEGFREATTILEQGTRFEALKEQHRRSQRKYHPTFAEQFRSRVQQALSAAEELARVKAALGRQKERKVAEILAHSHTGPQVKSHRRLRFLLNSERELHRREVYERSKLLAQQVLQSQLERRDLAETSRMALLQQPKGADSPYPILGSKARAQNRARVGRIKMIEDGQAKSPSVVDRLFHTRHVNLAAALAPKFTAMLYVQLPGAVACHSTKVRAVTPSFQQHPYPYQHQRNSFY